MARANPSKKKKSLGPDRPLHRQPAGIGAHKGRLLVLMGIMVALLCVLIGRWIYQGRTAPLPELPLLALDGVDPEVAAVLIEQRAAVEKAPRSADAWGKLAMLFQAHEFFDKARVCYSAAETLDSTNPNWPYFQGFLLQMGAHPDRAVSSFQRAAALAPDDWPVPRFHLADLLLDLGRIDEAEREYRNVLATKTDHKYTLFYAQFGLGKVMIARQRYQDALPFLQAVADDPYTRKRACALRAAVYERMDKRPDSDRERHLFATLPDDQPWPDGTEQVHELRVGWRGRIAIAKAMLSENQPAEALMMLEETVEKYPQTAEVWADLAIAKDNMKDFAGAAEAHRKSIALAPDRAEHRFEFGEFLQARERYQEAAAAFREAIERHPFDAAAYFRLGACLQSLGDNTGALDAYRMALRYKPDLSEARQRLELLRPKK